jgi:TRAP-type C4-dicarboxylate transport system permease large subunit
MTVIMEMGLIYPPVGLNIFVINKIAQDVDLIDVVLGTLPFVFLIMLAVLLLCLFLMIEDALPLYFFGPQTAR